MGGCIMDLAIPAVRANAIRSGVVWSGPSGAIAAALEDLGAGRVPWPDPATINEDCRERVQNMREYRAKLDEEAADAT